MERSIFAFIWKYSRREQLGLLAFTLFTFPFLYATLELPKRIINDAIGAETEIIQVFGYEVSQVQFLMALCFGYLGAVLVHGLLKMRLNTMKGVLAERLLRRFRYQLIRRMMRFPRGYFQTTSQGELVSMVTSEAEPMGGLMGDAVAQPVFQAGQMLIIVVFLFLQSFWFGLAGIALIPLQAWLIPLLQRQITQLNKERIGQVRLFAGEIGETAAGITDLRTSGGWRFRLAEFTDRLGRLFDVRFRIYQKKFFMKFLNNFITQLTPFFFYSVGGYLAIKGEITVGALVAALAAYKDLSSPWKELLAYYNQTQDMALRWDVVTERFQPSGIIDKDLFEKEPSELPRLQGDIELRNVSVRSAGGEQTLRDLNLVVPAGSQVALKSSSETERQALADLFTREINPSRGQVIIAGKDLAEYQQAVVAARIGYAHAQPYLFEGTIGENLLMPLKAHPAAAQEKSGRKSKNQIEARRSGNSHDSTQVEWLDPGIAELETTDDVYHHWFEVLEALGTSDVIFNRMLHSRMDPEVHPDLAERIVGLRDEMEARLTRSGLANIVARFDPDKFNPTVPLGGNLLFAAPRRWIGLEDLIARRSFIGMIMDQGLAPSVIAISQTVVETLHQTFGLDGTDHPLFTELEIDEEYYERLVDIAHRRRDYGDSALTEEEFTVLLTIPFAFTAEQIGPAFPDIFKEEIMRLRKSNGEKMRQETSELFMPIAPDQYFPRLTILENLLYGRVLSMAGLQADMVAEIASEILEDHDLKEAISATLYDVPTTIGGANLPITIQQRIAFGRAAIKRPDLLVLNQTLAGQEVEKQKDIRNRLSVLLPKTTQIHINSHFDNPDEFDVHVEIKNGRIDGVAQVETGDDEDAASSDLRRKLRIIGRNELFALLDARNRRLLAFAAQWYTAEEGTRIFSEGDRADAAYLCLSGYAELGVEDEDGKWRHVTDVEPGRLIGDLSILLDEPRKLCLLATEETKFLRIGAEQFRSVLESDSKMLLSLLKTVSGYLTNAAELMIASGLEVPREFGPPPPPIERLEASE